MSVDTGSETKTSIAERWNRGKNVYELRAALADLEKELPAETNTASPPADKTAAPPKTGRQWGTMVQDVLKALVVLAALVLLFYLARGVWALVEQASDLSAALQGNGTTPDAMSMLQQIASGVNKLAAAAPAPTPTTPKPAPTATPVPPTAMPIPPTATLVDASLHIKLTPLDKVPRVELAGQTCADAECNKPTPIPSPGPASNGIYVLPLAQQAFYRITMEAQPGFYVNASQLAADWNPAADPVTGFLTSATSKTQLKLDPGAAYTLTLEVGQVPPLERTPLDGSVAGSPPRKAPFLGAETTYANPPTVGTTVEALGEWSLAADKARLAHRTGSPVSEPEYFWGRFGDGKWVIALKDEAKAGTIPKIYLPDGFKTVTMPLSGWTVVSPTTDGLAVLESPAEAGQPLTWTLGTVQGWIKLEAWAVRGSAAVTYTVATNGQRLQPLAGTQAVAARDMQQVSAFTDIGTYYLSKPMPLSVILDLPAAPARAMMIRVILDTAK